ncbi:MAG TPA: hypothetical protein VNG93_12130 [Candidatus Dormibacteraeota bacterium]|nr:hypothetical protein [Candidatus Dormibacteraeota bacterium]
MSEAIRFRFDFADLLPPAVDLRVIEGGMALPEQARAITVCSRPGWLRPLLPIFAEDRGLRVEVARPAAPTFARILQEGLAGLFASAAAGSGVSVVGWEHGFLVGSHGLSRMPLEAHLTLVAADLLPESLEMAAGYLRLLPAERTVLVLNGSLAGLERVLPVPSAATHRLPLVGARELASRARGVPASLGSPRFGRACLELALEACRRYRASLP